MAKLAALLFATLAIHAAFAGSLDKNLKYESTYDVEQFDWKQGNDLDQYLMQLRIISKDVMDRLREIPQHEQLYTKNLNWHCRVLYKFFDSIIEKFEKDLSYGKGTDNVVLQKFFHELRDIQMTLREVEELSFEQLKYTINMCINKFVVQIEELVRYVDQHLTQGTLNHIIKYVLVDFITIIQNIDYQLKNFVHKEFTLMEIAMEIREMTRYLTKYLQDTSFNTVHVKQILRQYLYHLELLKNQHTLDTVMIDNELIVLFDQMYKKLYDIIAPLTETTKYDRFVNTDLLKREFIKELEIVCEEIYKYVELYETKYQGTERYWIIEKILKNYLFTIYRFKTDLMKDVKVDYYNKDIYKTDVKRSVFGIDTYYKKVDIYKKPTERGLTVELYAAVEDVINYFENLHLDNVVVKQTLKQFLRDYFMNLETIVDKLDEVYTYKQYDFGTEMKEIIYNLRQYIVSLKLIINEEHTFNTYELKHHMKIYLGKFTADLEKLIVLWQTNFDEVTEINMVLKNMIVKFLTYTRNFNKHLHNINQVTFAGKNYFDFGVQIETLVRDFIVELKSFSTDNIMFRDVLFTRVHKYCNFVREIVEMLEAKFEYNTLYHDQTYQKVIMNLRQIVDVLEQVVKHEDVSIDKLRSILIVSVENTVSEMKNLMWIWQKYGQEQEFLTVLFRMFNDFFVSMKNYHYQMDKVSMYGDKMYHGLEVRQDKFKLVSEIKKVVFDLTKIIRDDVDITVTKEDIRVYTTEIRKIIYIVDRIVQRLRMQVRDFEGDVMVLNKLIERLETSIMSLKRVLEYTTFTGITQLRKEFIQFLYVVVEQFDKLVMIDQEYRGRLDIDLTKVFGEYLMILQKFKVLCRYGYENYSTYRYSGDYKYGKKYGYDYDTTYNMKPLSWNTERKDYGYGKLYDFYYKPYETVNKKFDHGLKNDLYKREGEYTIDQLIEQIKIYTTKVTKDFEMVIRDTESKDVLVYQIRELVHILDTIIYKFEEVIKTYKHDVIYQIFENVKDMRRELYQIVHSDVIMTVYQLKTQFTMTIHNLTEKLIKLVWTVQDKTFVYDILYQYFGYLRNIHLKWEKNIENVEGPYRYNDFDSETRGYTGKVFNTIKLREFTTTIRHFMNLVQSKIYMVDHKEMIVLRQVLVKLEEILREVSGDYVAKIDYVRFQKLVRDVVYELKNCMTVFEQYGHDYDMYIWCKDLLQEFTFPVEKYFY